MKNYIFHGGMKDHILRYILRSNIFTMRIFLLLFIIVIEQTNKFVCKGGHPKKNKKNLEEKNKIYKK